MTEEGVHRYGAVSQFWCVVLAKLVRFLTRRQFGQNTKTGRGMCRVRGFD